MVFSSHLFLFYFLPITLFLYYITPFRWKSALLTLVSYIFYGWANPWFIFLMMFSTVLNYFSGLLISGRWRLKKNAEDFASQPVSDFQRKFWLTTSIIGNLGLLGFFKYFVFVQTNINTLIKAFGGTPFEIIKVALPTGISFYTFQAMSYTIDVYRGKVEPTNSLLDFACYVSLFPQLIAGPIVRYSQVAEQLKQRDHTLDKFSKGVLLFIIGFAKKILLANPMGEVADATFSAVSPIWYDAWIGIISYAFQIYFDFSGYSDMAVGLGLMLGFEFPMNFNHPYRAESITDFWRRWHISLSTWLRDYLYIPLGGNRKGPYRTYLNLMIVMLLGGLWHGAKWTFVIWGAIHGILLAYERMIGKDSLYKGLPKPLRIMITFVIVSIAWVFFRADNLSLAIEYLGSMFGLSSTHSGSVLIESVIYSKYHLIVFFCCVISVWFGKHSWEFAENITSVKVAAAVALFLMAVMSMFTQSYNPFLYFQF